MFGFVVILPLILALTDKSQATSEPWDKCDIIFYTILDVRENVLRNPSINEIFSDVIEEQTSVVEDRVGVSLDDDAALRDLACKVADATSLSELSDALNVPKRELKRVFQHTEESDLEEAIEMFGKIPKEIRKIHSWIKKSGFPDNWPLSVSFAETSKLLKKTPNIGKEAVGLGYAWGETDDEIASIVTNSTLTSMNEYLETLNEFSNGEVDPLLLALVRSLSEKTAMKDYIKLPETYQAAVQAFLDVKLLDLWKTK